MAAQKDLTGAVMKALDVDESRETRVIVTYKTKHYRVRTTPDSIESAADREIPDRTKWVTEKMRATDGEVDGVTFEKERKLLLRKIFG